jgi:hypothetical protein
MGSFQSNEQFFDAVGELAASLETSGRDRAASTSVTMLAGSLPLWLRIAASTIAMGFAAYRKHRWTDRHE